MSAPEGSSPYIMALEHAWRELIDWTVAERFSPDNEECIQSFLYRGIVNHLGTAIGVHPKPTRGKLSEKEMHFPDFVLGDPAQVVVEIKYARDGKSILASCKKDIRKMLLYYDSKRVQRVFILFDANPNFVFLNERRKASLLSEDPSCRLFYYPEELNPLRNSPADKAWVTMNKKKASD
jgi:hypothetical protein